MGAFGTVPFRSYGFVPRRSFSTDPNQEGKSKGGFFDFLKVMRKTDAVAAADPEATKAGVTEEAGQAEAEQSEAQKEVASATESDQSQEAAEMSEAAAAVDTESAQPSEEQNIEPVLTAHEAEQEAL